MLTLLTVGNTPPSERPRPSQHQAPESRASPRRWYPRARCATLSVYSSGGRPHGIRPDESPRVEAYRVLRVARTILSIAAAPGWAARYLDEDGEKVVTLLAWALVSDGGKRGLVGFVQRPATAEQPAGAVVLADEVEGFDGYTSGALRTRAD